MLFMVLCTWAAYLLISMVRDVADMKLAIRALEDECFLKKVDGE